MGLFDRNKRTGGFMDEIRCDEPDYLIWKWHPSGSQLGENQRENSIRWGSSLRVKDGEVAVFVYKQKDGTMQDFIEGPYDQILSTKNLPILASIVGLAYEGGTPFQAEVYFINLARLIQVRFAVPFFDVYDPRFSDFSVPVAVRGTISFGIKDYREFVKLHRLFSFNLDDFQKQIRDAANRYIKDAVANAPAAHNIPVIQIESKTAQINDAIEYDLSERMSDTFGVVVSGVDIGVIEIDKSSEGYRQLMSVTKDIVTATAQAEAQARVRDIHEKQRIEAENYEESLRIQREEGQYAQHMHTRTANFGAYQVEKQAEVGVAGAEALGQMGANGAGSIDLGNGGGGMGFNPAAMMASMAVGGVVGQNIAGTMNNAMAGMNPTAPGAVPPPVPVVAYHVAINGQAAGPFDLATLQQMAMAGQFVATSLVWKSGMAEWKKAGDEDELSKLFVNTPPPVPTE
ncbi:MAG: SPFH domain-containing protein [Oscillospiraceae bacterium]|nr:SPFH domain-containing protein [Oscillospiraceae bacterium]